MAKFDWQNSLFDLKFILFPIKSAEYDKCYGHDNWRVQRDSKNDNSLSARASNYQRSLWFFERKQTNLILKFCINKQS